MIAGCMDRMGANGCGSCERSDACSDFLAGWFGKGSSGRGATARRRPSTASPVRNAFFALLGEMAKSAERNARARRAGGEGGTPVRAAAKPAAPKDVPAAPAPGAGGRFSREVERHLEPLLASGLTGIQSVAGALGYSRQTLYRRLKAEGVTYEEILDRLRRRLALRFIREEGLSVKEAAWRLGFSDPAAFSRAFKRWTGASPRSMRPSRGGGGQSG